MLDRSIGEFARFLVIALGSSILGFSTGHWWLAISLGLAIYLGWILWQQDSFDHWLSNGRRGPAPTSFGVWGDISDDFYRLQRRHRREKQKLHAMLRRVQDSTSALREGIVALEDGASLAWWNPAAGQLLGLQPDDAGQPLVNFLRDPAFVRYLHSTDLKHEPLTLSAPGRAARMLQLEVTRYGQGEALVIVRDVTRLHRLEQMRQDFVANVSHELRTPLTVIAGYLETLEGSGQAPANWQRPLAQMREQTQRMTHLVNDLLLLARLETSERDSGREKVSVRELMERVANEARALSDGKHDIQVECDEQSVLTGDPTELHSAFANLVFNAVNYSPAGGPIRLHWSRDQRGGHFAVQDSGIGIDSLHIPRLTERFYRVDEGRARQSGGTGLGLAIVKHVLLRHGAEMTVHSTPGQGSTFTLHFPPQKLGSATAA
jgi:two-component system phosphate regulon sensor histidine kinase PhoR